MTYVTKTEVKNEGAWPFRTWKLYAYADEDKKKLIVKVEDYNNNGNAAKAEDFARKLKAKGYLLTNGQIEEINGLMLISVTNQIQMIGRSLMG